MFCPKCGTQNADGSSTCTRCGEALSAISTPVEQIPNYLAFSIFTTLCCCVPFGIVGIVFASQVNSKLAGGDIAGAKASSAKARMWSWIAFGVGLVINVLIVILQIIGGIAQHNARSGF